jgi:GNAT superfamily N-acetyltransferase
MGTMEEFTVGLLSPSAAEDGEAISALTELVNRVYVTAEDGLWLDGVERTSAADIAAFAKSGELAVAIIDERLVGCVRIQRLNDEIGEFGMLAADPASRGIGIGGELVRFAEQRAREWGCRTMQLEVLVPLEWNHSSKEFLDQWYRRMGYTVTRIGDLGELDPELVPLLATPCKLLVYHKTLWLGTSPDLSSPHGEVFRAPMEK